MLASLLLLLGAAHAIYVDLNEAGTWCFLEEVPKDTLVLATWNTKPSTQSESASSPRALAPAGPPARPPRGRWRAPPPFAQRTLAPTHALSVCGLSLAL